MKKIVVAILALTVCAGLSLFGCSSGKDSHSLIITPLPEDSVLENSSVGEQEEPEDTDGTTESTDGSEQTSAE